MGIILDGKDVANKVCEKLRGRVIELNKQGIDVRFNIYTSPDPASKVYVKNKLNRAKEIGINAKAIPMASAEELYDEVKRSKCPFIVQLPNPNIDNKHINDVLHMWEELDMDSFSDKAMGRLMKYGLIAKRLPCTPLGILTLLSYYNIPIEGRHVVILGRSDIVGKPLSLMFTNLNATTTLAHSKTPKMLLSKMLDSADIIVSAMGNTDVFKDYMAVNADKQVFVDVGMNRDDAGKLCGDASERFKQEFYAYTPTPGGTGPMTVAMLMSNIVDYYNNF